MKNNTHWLLALGAALALSACTTKNQSSYLEVTALVPPTGPASADGGTPTDCSFLPGTKPYTQQNFSTTAPEDFVVGVVVINNLASNADPGLGRINTNDFVVSQVVTTFESTDGTAIDAPEQITPAQGVVPVGETIAIGGTLIPEALLPNLATVKSVRLHIRVEGRLMDGSTVSTGEYLAVAVPVVGDQDSSTCVTTQ